MYRVIATYKCVNAFTYTDIYVNVYINNNRIFVGTYINIYHISIETCVEIIDTNIQNGSFEEERGRALRIIGRYIRDLNYFSNI